jgi:glycosyltransferase involved in cell wall biosynthesis
MATTPLVSVCIPTFNAARYIGGTVQSVLSQSVADFELIISDDASTDDTLERIGNFDDPRIRIVRNTTNAGLGANWNRAVREARAPFVKLLCQDDLIYPDCLEKQAAILVNSANSNVGLVCCRRDVIDDSGRVRLHGRGSLPAGRIEGEEAIRRVVRSGTNPIGEPAAVMFRADVFNAEGGFDGSAPYMIDVDFWCRALRKADLYLIPETLAAFRVSRGALSTILAPSQSGQARAFFSRLAADSSFPVTRLDALTGQLKATLLAPARRLVYRAIF